MRPSSRDRRLPSVSEALGHGVVGYNAYPSRDRFRRLKRCRCGHFPPLFHSFAVDKLAAKVRNGQFTGHPLVLLALSRAASYRGDRLPPAPAPTTVPDGVSGGASRTSVGEGACPAHLAAYTEASALAAAAARADPSSPLLALHAFLACYAAIHNGASWAYARSAASLGEGHIETLAALLPLHALHNRAMLQLANISRMTLPPRSRGGGGGGDNASAAPSASGTSLLLVSDPLAEVGLTLSLTAPPSPLLSTSSHAFPLRPHPSLCERRLPPLPSSRLPLPPSPSLSFPPLSPTHIPLPSLPAPSSTPEVDQRGAQLRHVLHAAAPLRRAPGCRHLAAAVGPRAEQGGAAVLHLRRHLLLVRGGAGALKGRGRALQSLRFGGFLKARPLLGLGPFTRPGSLS